jgi:predicted ATPase
MSYDRKPSNTTPSALSARRLSTTRLRSNSHGPLAQDLSDELTEAEVNSIAPPAPIYKIVLTGGPCGGKTTSLARLAPYLRERGFEVITCPEAFSLLVSNGMPFDYLGAVKGMDIVVQDTVMDMQIGMEDSFERVLRARGKPAVLLCDRGLMDGSAYMKEEDWNKLMRKREINCVSELREGRYNAVFHLVSAAEGAEEYYTLENNAVRTEPPELAKSLDHMTRNAWVGHPSLKIFDNSTDFETKLQRVVEETARLVGLPTHLPRVTTKFLLKKEPHLSAFPKEVAYQIFNVEKVYLYEENENENISQENVLKEYSFIRKRTSLDKSGNESGSVYGWTVVQKTRDGQTIEKKRIITKREYTSLFNNRDKSRYIVRQKRISFLWNLQSFNVHVFKEPSDDICILHAQVQSSPDNNDKVDMPSFLDVDRLITDSVEDEAYGAHQISLIK